MQRDMERGQETDGGEVRKGEQRDGPTGRKEWKETHTDGHGGCKGGHMGAEGLRTDVGPARLELPGPSWL